MKTLFTRQSSGFICRAKGRMNSQCKGVLMEHRFGTFATATRLHWHEVLIGPATRWHIITQVLYVFVYFHWLANWWELQLGDMQQNVKIEWTFSYLPSRAVSSQMAAVNLRAGVMDVFRGNKTEPANLSALQEVLFHGRVLSRWPGKGECVRVRVCCDSRRAILCGFSAHKIQHPPFNSTTGDCTY